MNAAECAERIESLEHAGSDIRYRLICLNNDGTFRQAAETMRKLSAGELVEVVHGTWKQVQSDWPRQGGGYNHYFVCSECGRKLLGNRKNTPYCNCGAKMDEKDDSNAV